MRFSLNFVKEFLRVNLSAQELASRLTMAGTEVEHFEKVDGPASPAGGDWVFDIEVTSNRYDLLSILGIAREIATCTHKKFPPKADQLLLAEGGNKPSLKKRPLLKNREIIIENIKDCPFYVARAIRKTEVLDSPLWLKSRLLNCQINSINNVVDITNYCMLKWGNPLHAFDEDKIEGNIYIRRAKRAETFLGIDEKMRVLSEENLVIADEKKVIALAGVMGAKNTEVDKNTKNIFLEAAIFSPLTVRRSRRAAGIDTESSYRFERRVNPDYLEYASYESGKLIERLGKGKFFGYKEAGKKPPVKSKKITISLSSLNSYLGMDSSKQKVKETLENLNFKIKPLAKDKISVICPSFRFDIQREVDVYEEFARIYGYEKINPKIPFLHPQPKKGSIYEFKNELRRLLPTFGLNEIITYSIEAEEDLNNLGEAQLIRILNPLREEEDTLRPTLLLGMIKSAKYNLNRNQTNLSFFEIANVYLKGKGGLLEFPYLSLGASGETNNFFYLKGVIEQILNYLSIEGYELKPATLQRPGFANASKIVIDGKDLGFLGKLDQKLKDGFDLKEDLFFSELNIALLQKVRRVKSYKPFSPYPAILRDISCVLSKENTFKNIKEIIEKVAKDNLFDLRIIDVYRGKDIPKEHSAFTLRIFYQSKTETLTSQFVDSLHKKIRENLSAAPGIILR